MALATLYLSTSTQNMTEKESPQWHSHRGVKGGRVPPLIAKNLPKIRKKEGENQEKREKISKKRTNWEGSFTLPLLTDRAGYATGSPNKCILKPQFIT